MKKIIGILAIVGTLYACATSSPNNNSGSQANNYDQSAEAEARNVTNRMRDSLSLDQVQENKVLTLNVTNIKLLRRFKEVNDAAQISNTKSTYQSRIKSILNDTQFSKFQTTFPEL